MGAVEVLAVEEFLEEGRLGARGFLLEDARADEAADVVVDRVAEDGGDEEEERDEPNVDLGAFPGGEGSDGEEEGVSGRKGAMTRPVSAKMIAKRSA